MKSNKSQIILLYVLLLIIAAFLFFTYVLKPVKSKTEQLATEVSNTDMIVRNMYLETLSYENSMQELEKTRSDVYEVAERFYVDEKQQTWLDTLNVWMKESGLVLNSISSSEFSTVEYYDEGDLEEAFINHLDIDAQMTLDDLLLSQKDISEESDRIVLSEMDIQFIATGSYQQVMNFLEKISANDKYVVCRQVEIDKSYDTEDSEQTRFDIILGFVDLSNVDRSISYANDFKYPDSFVMPDEFINYQYKESSFIDFIKHQYKDWPFIDFIKTVFHF